MGRSLGFEVGVWGFGSRVLGFRLGTSCPAARPTGTVDNKSPARLNTSYIELWNDGR